MTQAVSHMAGEFGYLSQYVIVKGQLSTELSISSAEFDVYDIYEPPITIGLHLREFMVSGLRLISDTVLTRCRRP